MATPHSSPRAVATRPSSAVSRPKSWTDDRDRCAGAGVPDEVGFATKPELGLAMLERAHAAGVLSGWVTADETYGQNRRFRDWLAARAVLSVLATRSDDLLTCPDGRRHQAKDPGGVGRVRQLGTAVGRGRCAR